MLEKLSDFKLVDVDAVEDFLVSSGSTLKTIYPKRANITLPLDDMSELDEASIAYVPKLIDVAYLIEAVTERQRLMSMTSGTSFIEMSGDDMKPSFWNLGYVERFVKAQADHWVTAKGGAPNSYLTGYLKPDVDPPTSWTKLGPSVSVTVSRWLNGYEASELLSLSTAYQYATNLFSDPELFPDGRPFTTKKEIVEVLGDVELYDFLSPEAFEGIRPEENEGDDGNVIVTWSEPDEDFESPGFRMLGKHVASVYSDLERMTTCVVSPVSAPNLVVTGSNGLSGTSTWHIAGLSFNHCTWKGNNVSTNGSYNYEPSGNQTWTVGFNGLGKDFLTSLGGGGYNMFGKYSDSRKYEHYSDNIPSSDLNWIIACTSWRGTNGGSNKRKTEATPSGSTTYVLSASALGTAEELRDLVDAAWLGIVAETYSESGSAESRGGTSPTESEPGSGSYPILNVTKVTGNIRAGAMIRFVAGRLEGTDLKFDLDVSDLPDAPDDADVSRTYDGESGDPDGYPQVVESVISVPCSDPDDSDCTLTNYVQRGSADFETSYSRIACIGPLVIRYRPRTLVEED